jgi:hypothetical protein
MRKGVLISEEMRKYLTIYEEAIRHIFHFATDPVRTSLYMREILFSFLSVYSSPTTCPVRKKDRVPVGDGLGDQQATSHHHHSQQHLRALSCSLFIASCPEVGLQIGGGGGGGGGTKPAENSDTKW